MSEGKEGAHSKDRTNLAGIGFSGEGGPLPALKRRAKAGSVGMTGPGLLDEFNPDQPSIITEKALLTTKTEQKVSNRSPLFKKGTILFKSAINDSTGFPILPRDEYEAERMRADVLDFETNLDISKKCLELNKNGITTIKRLGKTPLGAFVEVDLQSKNARGENVVVKRVVRFQDRVMPDQNPKRRFAQKSR